MSPDLKGLKRRLKGKWSIFHSHQFSGSNVRNFGGVIVLVCRGFTTSKKTSDPGNLWNDFMDQGSKAFPLRKNMGATTGSSQKKHEHVLFGGRNGFSKNSFKVVIQRDSQRWVSLRSRMLFHWHFGQWKSKNHPKIPDGRSASAAYRIVLFKASDFNHQTI